MQFAFVRDLDGNSNIPLTTRRTNTDSKFKFLALVLEFVQTRHLEYHFRACPHNRTSNARTRS